MTPDQTPALIETLAAGAALIGPKRTIDVEDLPANVRKVGVGVIQVPVGTRPTPCNSTES